MIDKNKTMYYCQICGLDCEETDLCSFDLCVCCGAEFGYDDDDNDAIFSYRQNWFNKGAPLHYAESERLPKNWTLNNLKTQLANIGFNLTDEMIAEIEKNRRKR